MFIVFFVGKLFGKMPLLRDFHYIQPCKFSIVERNLGIQGFTKTNKTIKIISGRRDAGQPPGGEESQPCAH